MIRPLRKPPGDLARHLLVVGTPARWPGWPFLPLVRRTRGAEELGVVADLLGAHGLPGYSAAVFLLNVFELPPTVGGLLLLPKEVYDSADELIAAGWRVD